MHETFGDARFILGGGQGVDIFGGSSLPNGATNLEQLKELKNDLESLEGCHREILEKEPTIARKVHDAADEARRKYKQVKE